MKPWLTSLLLLTTGIQIYAQEAVIFTKDTEIGLNPYLFYFIDSAGTLEVDDIRDYSQKFQRVGSQDIRLGVDESVAWLKLRIHNPYDRKEDAVIDFKDPSLYHLTLYQINSEPLFSGTGVPQAKKNIRGHHNAFILSLSSGETRDILIRIDSKNFITLKASMEDDEFFFQKTGTEKTFLGFYYGILTLIFIYSIILFYLSNINYFLWYGLYILINALFTGTSDGLMPQFLYFLVEWTNGYHDLIIAVLANLIGMFFLRSYFRPCEWSPRTNRAILITIFSIIGISILFFIFDPDSGFAVMRIVGLVTLGFFLGVSYMGIRRNISGSQIYFLAFSVFGVFILIFIANLFRLIPFTHFIQYSTHYGFLLGNVILSGALGARIYQLYQSYLREQQDKQILVEQKNEELEILVQDRTSVLARKENQLRSILDNSGGVIWLVNPQYELLEFNLAFQTAWKMAYGRELRKGKNILQQLDDEEIRAQWKERYDKIFTGEVLRTTDIYEVNGETRNYDILGVPIRSNGTVEFAAVFSTDITERILYEEQLKSQNADLRKVNQELDSFVYSASHDLKAPLSSLQGLISLLKLETDQNLKEKYYFMMEKSIKRLDQFIRDIIDYSRNTRVEIRISPIDIRELIGSVFEDLHYMDHAKDFIIHTDIQQSGPFNNDETRLRIVLRNLFSNGLRYGFKEGGQKKLEVTGMVDEEKLVLHIRDFGPGIPEEHRDNIFKMFYRAHEGSEGTGLGLYIVKETLEKMGGGIRLETSEAGTLFSLHVPNMPGE